MTKHLARRQAAQRPRFSAVPSLLLLLLSLSFFACQQAATNEPQDNSKQAVSGVLQDEQGYSLPEATIEALNGNTILATATADEDGRFELMLPVNLDGIKIRVSRADIKPFLKDLATFIQKAGGRTGIMLDGEHDDSCCGKVSFTVTSGNDAINHAEVKLRQGDHLFSKAYTNDQGKLTFGHVCAGTYGIRIAKDGFKVKEFNVTVGDNCDSIYQAITLESNGTPTDDSCCHSTFDFVVKNSSNEVLNGVQIKLRKGDADYIIKNTENGGAHFTELCEGIYAVRIAKDGYAVQEFSIEVGCNTEGSLTKTLLSSGGGADSCCHGQIRIVARNANNEIISGAVVRLWKGGTKIKQETMHDGVTFSGLCEGNYSISISADGYTGQEFSFELGCNDTLDTFNKTLAAIQNNADSCCHGVLWLVLNEDGTSTKLSNATVKLWKGSTLLKTGTTNADGLVKFDGLCQGDNYSVSMFREGYVSKEFDNDLDFGCNDSIELHRAMVKNNNDCCTGILKLRVKDSTNMTYINGATCKIYKNGTLLETFTSGVEGWALVDGLCGNSNYTVVISKDGYHSREMHFSYTECVTKQETVWLLPE
jgi:hypothetical protein